tara:strand:+ start:805 stop:1095 length:291 start_codon:yes stop_codon:yes gene_type:complete
VQKINIYSKSPEFVEFIKKMDSILSKTQHLTPNGKGMDVEDQHFKDQRTRLATVRLEFEWSHPIYPINEYVASDLVYSEIAAIQDEEDKRASVVDV